MNRAWSGSLRVTAREANLLVKDNEQGDLLKARLPMAPRHPRALLTLIEGLALWRGEPMPIALSATDPSPPGLDSDLFGDEFWPGESPLVRFYIDIPVRRRRLTGVGDFRALRRRGGS